MYEIKKNEQFNSNEVYFDGIPAAKTREVLYKSVKDGMRYNNYFKINNSEIVR